jgi:hypothetical protein
MQTTETNNMNEANPIDLLFGGMEKLGPGSNSDTQKVLNMLSTLSQDFQQTFRDLIEMVEHEK